LLVLILGPGCATLAMDKDGSSSDSKQNSLQPALRLLGYTKSDATFENGFLVSNKLPDIGRTALEAVIHKYLLDLNIISKEKTYVELVKHRITKFSSNSSLLAITPGNRVYHSDRGCDEGVDIYDVATGTTKSLLCVGAGLLRCANTEFDPNGKKIVVDHNGSFGVMPIWDIETAKVTSQLKYGEKFEDAVRALCWNKHGNTIATVNKETVVLWDTKSGQKNNTFKLGNVSSSMQEKAKIAYNPSDDNQLAILLGPVMRFWDVRKVKCLKCIDTSKGELKEVELWMPKVSLSEQAQNRQVYEERSLRLDSDFKIKCIAYSPNRKIKATGRQSKSWGHTTELKKHLDNNWFGTFTKELGWESVDNSSELQSICWAFDNTALVERLKDVDCWGKTVREKYKVHDLAGKLRQEPVNNLLFLLSSKNNDDLNKKFESKLGTEALRLAKLSGPLEVIELVSDERYKKDIDNTIGGFGGHNHIIQRRIRHYHMNRINEGEQGLVQEKTLNKV